jgi:hypothetical protein
MSMNVEVDLYCSDCGKSIDEDEIFCSKCADVPKGPVTDLLMKLTPYVSEATIMKPVEIPGELAFEIQQALRAMEK